MSFILIGLIVDLTRLPLTFLVITSPKITLSLSSFCQISYILSQDPTSDRCKCIGTTYQIFVFSIRATSIAIAGTSL